MSKSLLSLLPYLELVTNRSKALALRAQTLSSLAAICLRASDVRWRGARGKSLPTPTICASISITFSFRVHRHGGIIISWRWDPTPHNSNNKSKISIVWISFRNQCRQVEPATGFSNYGAGQQNANFYTIFTISHFEYKKISWKRYKVNTDTLDNH